MAATSARSTTEPMSIHRAAYEGKVSLVRSLAADRTAIESMDENGYCPIHFAATKNQLKVIRLLISLGADVNIQTRGRKQTALHLSARSGHVESMIVLATNGANLEILDGSEDGKAPIHMAAKYGQMAPTLWLLRRGVSANSKSGIGVTPIFYALQHGYDSLVRALVQRNADVNIQVPCLGGATPLHLAVKKDNKNMVTLLLKHGAKSSFTAYSHLRQETPLHWAAMYGHTDIMNILKNAGADILVRTDNNVGNTPIHLAAKSCSVVALDWLLHKGVPENVTNYLGYAPLHLAVMYESHELIDYMLINGYDVNVRTSGKQRLTPLCLAASKGLLSVMQLLMRHNARIHEKMGQKGKTVLHYATKFDKLVSVIELAESGCDIFVNTEENDGESLMVTAAKYNSKLVMAWLINKGIPTDIKNSKGMTPLHYAAGGGCKEVTIQLINAGAVINSVDKGQQTPLHFAVFAKRVDIVVTLISEKCDISPKDRSGMNALHIACATGCLAILKTLLLKGGHDYLEIGDKHGDLPVHIAALYGHVSLLKFLVEQGAQVNSTNYTGHTPLMKASQKGELGSVKFLLESSADATAQCITDGRTALHMAAVHGHAKVVKLLMLHKADVGATTYQTKRTPLHWAVLNKRLAATRTLVLLKADVTARDAYGMTPQEIANVREFQDIIHLFNTVKHKQGFKTSLSI